VKRIRTKLANCNTADNVVCLEIGLGQEEAKGRDLKGKKEFSPVWGKECEKTSTSLRKYLIGNVYLNRQVLVRTNKREVNERRGTDLAPRREKK